jgi:hypothetical protein
VPPSETAATAVVDIRAQASTDLVVGCSTTAVTVRVATSIISSWT